MAIASIFPDQTTMFPPFISASTSPVVFKLLNDGFLTSLHLSFNASTSKLILALLLLNVALNLVLHKVEELLSVLANATSLPAPSLTLIPPVSIEMVNLSDLAGLPAAAIWYLDAAFGVD